MESWRKLLNICTYTWPAMRTQVVEQNFVLPSKYLSLTLKIWKSGFSFDHTFILLHAKPSRPATKTRWRCLQMSYFLHHDALKSYAYVRSYTMAIFTNLNYCYFEHLAYNRIKSRQITYNLLKKNLFANLCCIIDIIYYM